MGDFRGKLSAVEIETDHLSSRFTFKLRRLVREEKTPQACCVAFTPLPIIANIHDTSRSQTSSSPYCDSPCWTHRTSLCYLRHAIRSLSWDGSFLRSSSWGCQVLYLVYLIISYCKYAEEANTTHPAAEARRRRRKVVQFPQKDNPGTRNHRPIPIHVSCITHNEGNDLPALRILDQKLLPFWGPLLHEAVVPQ